MGCIFVSRREKDWYLTINLSGWLHITSEKTTGPSQFEGEFKSFKWCVFFFFLHSVLLYFQDYFSKASMFSYFLSFICLLNASLRQADAVTVCWTVIWSSQWCRQLPWIIDSLSKDWPLKREGNELYLGSWTWSVSSPVLSRMDGGKDLTGSPQGQRCRYCLCASCILKDSFKWLAGLSFVPLVRMAICRSLSLIWHETLNPELLFLVPGLCFLPGSQNWSQSQNLCLSWLSFMCSLESDMLDTTDQVCSYFESQRILKMFELFASLQSNSQGWIFLLFFFCFILCVWVFCLHVWRCTLHMPHA